jgi:RNA polymerase sigma-70 factor, ECF subfamily
LINPPTYHIEDSAIVALLKQHDQKGIALAYDKFHAALYGVILKIVNDEALAEEVLQDTFVKAWRHRDSYDDSKGRLFTWLINIARNTAIDYTRLKSFSQKNQDIDSSVNSIDSSENLTINVDTIGLKEMVNKMPEEQRILLEYVYFKGYTQAEVAEKLNIPLGTVKTRLRTAIQHLGKYFNLE